MYLRNGLMPVTTGDVFVDEKQGCTIWSCEEIFTFLTKKLPFPIREIVYVTETNGVYGLDKKVIPQITPDNWPKIKKAVGASSGFDVTGGMKLKMEESLKLAKKGINVKIISGLQEDNLYDALIDKKWAGTLVTLP